MELNRRTFFVSIAGLAGVGATAFTLGCGGGTEDQTTNDGEDCQDGVQNSQISQNHGHSLAIPAGDIEAGAGKSYSIKGSADHNHDLALTADDFAMIMAGSEVTITSTNDDGHTHEVTIRCT